MLRRYFAPMMLLFMLVGYVIASNVAVKFNAPLTHAGWTYSISLPVNNKFTTADSLLQDLRTKCGSDNIAGVLRIAPSSGGNSRQGWLSPGTGVNFSISKGEGYLVQLPSGFSGPCQWLVVGSHDDSFSYSFAQSGSPLKSYFVSVPYNSTAETANDLLTSIPDCTQVTRIVPSAGGVTRQGWLAPGVGVNFAVVPGEAYLVETSQTSSWTPAHY